MKNKIIAIALLVIFVLGACTEARPLQLPLTLTSSSTATDIPSMPSSTATLMSLPTFASISTLPGGVTPTYPPYHTPTPTGTATPSSTPDYAALGIPSPAPTPTFNYDGLSSFYLTPFTPPPTRTGIPSLTPTAVIGNMLSGVAIRKVIPQRPPYVISGEALIQQDASEWLPPYIQAATDLMNYVDGDEELYLQYVESLEPGALKYAPDDWFLEEDFDNDGLAEWLVSIPVRFEPDGMNRCGWLSHFGYCPRFFFIFEKNDNAYYPMYVFKPTQWYFSEARVSFVDDLNNNNMKEIVFRADPCGAAVCSTDLYIGTWNGQNWESHGYIGNDYARVTFADLDGNKTIEIKLAYPTYAASRYNSPYSRREVIDIYGWKNDRYEIVDQIYPPTNSIFEIIFDIASVLEYENTEIALKYAKPVMDDLDESCDRMKTYVGIQTMLAYAFQNNSEAMKSTLAKLEKYCDHPRNAYIPAAKILWLSYQKSHDPINACQAMERFLGSEYNRENDRWTETLFIDGRLTNRPSCPRQ